MKQILASVFALAFSFGVFVENAEAAKRLGGGGNVGAQRSVTSTPKQATPPTQQQAAPAAAGKAAPAPAAAPAGNRWLGPLAGLAAGLGLGYLFSQGGLGGMMSALLMGLVAVVVVVMLMRFLGRRNAAQQPMQYAGMGQQPVAIPPSAPAPLDAPRAADPAPAFGSAAAAAPVAAANVPAGFDVEGFLKQGKRNFLMLQQANDAGDVALIKDVTTEEMFEALRPQLNERVASGDSLEVSSLEASLLEVTSEGEYHWASIRFHGMMREGAGASPAPFEEVWNLRKPVAGNSGWLLAGIQQVS